MEVVENASKVVHLQAWGKGTVEASPMSPSGGEDEEGVKAKPQ